MTRWGQADQRLVIGKRRSEAEVSGRLLLGGSAYARSLPFTQISDLMRQQVGGLERQIRAIANQFQRPFPVHEAEGAFLQGLGRKAVRLAGEQRWQAEHVSRAHDSIRCLQVMVMSRDGQADPPMAQHKDAVSGLSLPEQHPSLAAGMRCGDGIQRLGKLADNVGMYVVIGLQELHPQSRLSSYRADNRRSDEGHRSA